MFPSWASGVLLRSAILGVVVLGVVVGAWCVNASQVRQTPPRKEVGPAAPRASVPEVGPSRPRPSNRGVAREARPEKVQGKAAGKLASLAEAIGLVERADKRQVVRAEKAGEGAGVHFLIDVL